MGRGWGDKGGGGGGKGGTLGTAAEQKQKQARTKFGPRFPGPLSPYLVAIRFCTPLSQLPPGNQFLHSPVTATTWQPGFVSPISAATWRPGVVFPCHCYHLATKPTRCEPAVRDTGVRSPSACRAVEFWAGFAADGWCHVRGPGPGPHHWLSGKLRRLCRPVIPFGFSSPWHYLPVIYSGSQTKVVWVTGALKGTRPLRVTSM